MFIKMTSNLNEKMVFTLMYDHLHNQKYQTRR